MMKRLTLSLALLLAAAPALAQTLPLGSVATGRGPGVSGLNGVAPGVAGTGLVSNGVGAQPSFQAIGIINGNNVWVGTNIFTLTNAGTSNAFPLQTQMNRTTTVGTGGIFMGGNFIVTDTGSTQGLSNQGIRVNIINSNTGGGSSFGDIGAVLNYTANENQNNYYGAHFTGSVAAAKTVSNWYSIQIDAPTGTGTVTSKRAINIAANAGPIVQNDTTNSTLPSNGAVVVAGGVGVVGNIITSGLVGAYGTSAGYTAFSGVSSDGGTAIGPYLELYRASPSAVNGDNLGALAFTANSDNGTKRSIAAIYANLLNAANGSETGVIYFNNIHVGTPGVVEALISRGMSIGNVATLGVAGSLRVGATTASTSTTTGAAVVDGGLGVAGNLVIGQSFVAASGYIRVPAPVTKTGDATLTDAESFIINNKAGSNLSITLPAAASYPGRTLVFKTIVAFSIVSASSNVVPRAGGAAGTTITGNVAGNWATIVSDGTNWVIMQGS